MRKIDVKLNDTQEKNLDELLAFVGASGETASDRFRDFVAKLHSKLLLARDSQAVSNQLGEHQHQPIDTSCNLRVEVDEIRRNGKDSYTVQQFYCLQFKAGTLKRQLKLVSATVCEVCSLIRERLLEETKDDQPTEQPLTVPTARRQEPAPEPKPKPSEKRYCSDFGGWVRLMRCDDCKRATATKWYACASRRLEAHEKPLRD